MRRLASHGHELTGWGDHRHAHALMRPSAPLAPFVLNLQRSHQGDRIAGSRDRARRGLQDRCKKAAGGPPSSRVIYEFAREVWCAWWGSNEQPADNDDNRSESNRSRPSSIHVGSRNIGGFSRRFDSK